MKALLQPMRLVIEAALIHVDASNFKAWLQLLSTVIDAASLSGHAEKKLVALVLCQTQRRTIPTA